MAMGGKNERGYRIGVEEASNGFIIEVTRQYEAMLHAGASVRSLTPTECERLQALPDGWTDLGGTPDSRRYAGLGDAVTASVAEWIGRRILEAEAAA